MRRYSEAVKADVRRRMGPPQRQSVAEISQQLGIPVITLYKWRKAWRLQGEVVPASQKDPEGWGPAVKFTVVLETAGLNATTPLPWKLCLSHGHIANRSSQPVATDWVSLDPSRSEGGNARHRARLAMVSNNLELAPC